MADSHWSVRERAENALLNFGSGAVLPLIAALESPHWITRRRAARLLGEIGDPRAVEPLKRILTLKGEREKVRERAAAALKKFQDKLPASTGSLFIVNYSS